MACIVWHTKTKSKSRSLQGVLKQSARQAESMKPSNASFLIANLVQINWKSLDATMNSTPQCSYNDIFLFSGLLTQLLLQLELGDVVVVSDLRSSNIMGNPEIKQELINNFCQNNLNLNQIQIIFRMSFEARQSYASELLRHLNLCRFNWLPYYDDQMVTQLIESIGMNNELNVIGIIKDEPDVPQDDNYETLYDYTKKEDSMVLGHLNIHKLTEQAKLCYKSMLDTFIDQYEFFQSNHYTHCHIHLYETKYNYLIVMTFTKKICTIDAIEQRKNGLRISGLAYTSEIQGCALREGNQQFYFGVSTMNEEGQMWSYEIFVDNNQCPSLLPLTVMSANYKISLATISIFCNNQECLVQDLQEQKSSLSLSSCLLAKKLTNRVPDRGMNLNKSRLVDKANQIVSQKQSGFEQEFQKKSFNEKQFGNLFKIDENQNEYLISSAKHLPVISYSSIVGESQMMSNLTIEPDMLASTIYAQPSQMQQDQFYLDYQRQVKEMQEFQLLQQQQQLIQEQQQQYLMSQYYQQQVQQQQQQQQLINQQQQQQQYYYQLQQQQQHELINLQQQCQQQYYIINQTEEQHQQFHEEQEIGVQQNIEYQAQTSASEFDADEEQKLHDTNNNRKNRLSQLINSPAPTKKRRSSLQNRQSIQIRQRQEENLKKQGAKLVQNKSQYSYLNNNLNVHPLDFSDLKSHRAQRKMQEVEETLKSTLNANNQSFKPLYKNEKLSDFTIHAMGVEFKSHKSVLVQVSPFFKELIESNAKTFYVQEENFEIIYKFIYYGNLCQTQWNDISIEEANGLYSMAIKFRLDTFLASLIARVIMPKMQIRYCLQWYLKIYNQELLNQYLITYFTIYSKQILKLVRKYYQSINDPMGEKKNEETILANKYVTEFQALQACQIESLTSAALKVFQDYEHLENLLWLIREKMDLKQNEELLRCWSKKFEAFRSFKFKDFTESVLEDHAANAILYYPTRKEKQELREFEEGQQKPVYQVEISNKPVYELHLNLSLEIPSFKQFTHLFINLSDCYIVSEAFQSNSNKWRLILEIDDKGILSIFLQNRGPIEQDSSKANFLTVKIRFECKSIGIQCILVISENGGLLIQHQLYHSYPANQYYSAGIGNIAQVNNRIQIRVTIEEDYTHSGLLTWMAHNYLHLKATLPKWDFYSILCSDMLNVENEDQVIPAVKDQGEELLLHGVRFTFVDMKLVFSMARGCEKLKQSKVFQEILSSLVDGQAFYERTRKLYRFNADRERKSKNFKKDLMAWLLETRRESLDQRKSHKKQSQQPVESRVKKCEEWSIPAKRSITHLPIVNYSREIAQPFSDDKENFNNNCLLI